MELLNGTISATSTPEQIAAIEKQVEARLKDYPTNQFGIKLPIGLHKGIATGEKPYLNWSKSETNKGTILSAWFNFDVVKEGKTVTIKERVNFSEFKDWQRIGKDVKINVEIKTKSATDLTLVCKILAITVSDIIPPKEDKAGELPESLKDLKAHYEKLAGKPYAGVSNKARVTEAINLITA